MVTRVRNKGCFPFLSTEGELIKPLPEVGPKSAIDCRRTLDPFQRLHHNQTLASVRRYFYFKPYSGLIPQDALDLVLASSYNHADDAFQDKVDVVLQEETLGIDTWRRLRNTRDIQPEKDAISKAATAAMSSVPLENEDMRKEKLIKYNEFHPIHIGGITEKRHPSNVKLMNSSHHSPQTNAGYSRQDSDGNSYMY